MDFRGNSASNVAGYETFTKCSSPIQVLQFVEIKWNVQPHMHSEDAISPDMG